MRPVLLFVLFSLLGAVVAALAMFLYQAYILASSGVSPDTVPIKTMLLEVMELHLYAIYGAVAGGMLGEVGPNHKGPQGMRDEMDPATILVTALEILTVKICDDLFD